MNEMTLMVGRKKVEWKICELITNVLQCWKMEAKQNKSTTATTTTNIKTRTQEFSVVLPTV